MPFHKTHKHQNKMSSCDETIITYEHIISFEQRYQIAHSREVT